MAWVLLSPVHLLLRPALVPITGGLLGLFYGTYDLTLITVGSITNMKPAQSAPSTTKLPRFQAVLVYPVFFVRAVALDPPLWFQNLTSK